MLKISIHLMAALSVITDTKLTPHGLGVDDTYTITSTIEVTRPCHPDQLTDAYQDVKVLSDDGTTYTLSVTYFPLNDKVRKLRTQAYATKLGDLNQYLKPSITCNWDAQMRSELLRDLKRDGIDPSSLQPAALVTKVSQWAFRTSVFASNSTAMPSDWFVAFDGGQAHVYPPTRASFERSKQNANWTDQDIFDHQLFGKQMYNNRSHGACTSSSIYLATILRALGIPTRILYFIPPCDANDDKQVRMLSTAISRRMTRQTVIDGVRGAIGFSNHMFNEVWLDGRWQRLNYTNLGQEIVDGTYLGLMTHIETCADIAETHLAETWGVRAANYPDVKPKLSSINPYQLIATSDHWGRNAQHNDPAPQMLTQVTVNGVLWPGTPGYREMVPSDEGMPKTDIILTIAEWISGRSYTQLREFIADADTHLVLRSPGHPDVHIHYNGLNVSNSSTRGFAFTIDSPATSKILKEVRYAVVPLNKNAKHTWRTAQGLFITKP